MTFVCKLGRCLRQKRRSTGRRLKKTGPAFLDFAGPLNGAMILVAVDSHSKWIEAVPMQHATAESTITALREMFNRFGIPRTIVTDNGTQFTSETFAKFLSGNNVMHLRTAP